MGFYTDKVNLTEFEKRFKRSNLSFKYTLLDCTPDINKKGETVIVLTLTPSGYDNPKYFINGEFNPEAVENKKLFTIVVSDFDVSGSTLSKPQKRLLFKTMHEGKPYTQSFYSDYKDYHRARLEKELNTKLAVMNRFKDALIKNKGQKHVDLYEKSLKEEYRDQIDELQYVFTQWEKQ